jgi:hypothetical protein
MAVIRNEDAAMWEIEKTPIEAGRFIEEVKEEILEIYEDIQSLKLMEVRYGE